MHSHDVGSISKYQAAVMRRENDGLPWVNMLLGNPGGSRELAMWVLLQRTEDELAKYLSGKGVTLPLGDDRTGFEVTHLARGGSAVSLNESLEGSEFEFIATPASSSAGDFSEDEDAKDTDEEQDTCIEATPSSAHAQAVHTVEECRLQQSVTPVEVSSEPLDPVKKVTNTMANEKQEACGIQDANTNKEKAFDMAFNEVKHAPWAAPPTKCHLYGNRFEKRDEQWRAGRLVMKDPKSGLWADVVEELEELAQENRLPRGLKHLKGTNSPNMAKFYSDTARPHKLHTNIWGPKWEPGDGANRKDKDLLKEKEGSFSSIREPQGSKTPISKSKNEAPELSATASAEEKENEIKLKHHRPSDDLISAQPFHDSQSSSPHGNRTSLGDSTVPISSAKVYSPVDTDSWGKWPLPAKSRKPQTTGSNPLDGSNSEKVDISNSNPWSAIRNANAAWREPDAVLDEYNSSLWGTTRRTKKNNSTNFTPLVVSGTKLSENESGVSSPIEHVATRVAELGISPFSNPRRSRTVPKLSGAKPVSNIHGWGQFDISTAAQGKSHPSVILPVPERNETTCYNQSQANPKNPFDRSHKSSEHSELKLHAVEKDPWNFGMFTSKQNQLTGKIPDTAAEEDPWSWKSVKPKLNQQEKEVGKVTRVVDTKLSPWPYLEPESRPSAMASSSHQSLLDDLAEWGSFGTKEKRKNKKPIAFDYLVETPLEFAPAKLSTHDFESGSIVSQKKNSRKEKSVVQKKTGYQYTNVLDFSEEEGSGMGFGTFSIANSSTESSSPNFAWNPYNDEKKTSSKDDPTVSEMPGEEKSATAPVHADAQKEYLTNVLGLNKPKEAPSPTVASTPTQPMQAPSIRLYAFNITYKHLLATEHFRHIINASFTKKAAIVEEVNKFISAREPFGQIYKRKIVICSARVEDETIELERLDEGSWSDILGFLENTLNSPLNVIEVTVTVDDV